MDVSVNDGVSGVRWQIAAGPPTAAVGVGEIGLRLHARQTAQSDVASST
jgi:hypothetical protein